MKGFRIGHCSPQTAVAIGSYATMSTHQRTVEFESGIALPKDKIER
jgi:muramoyltetrapeptide carboxypeptidase